VAERIRRQFGLSVLTGFILMVVVPVAALLVLLTVVGIPLSLVVMFLYLATLYPGQIFAALWLGDWLLGRLGRTGASPYLAMTVGVIVLVIVVAVPFAGWLLRLVAILAGFGALWAAVWATRSARQAA
jgi:hypothetical protein